jgi:hypothetical protein
MSARVASRCGRPKHPRPLLGGWLTSATLIVSTVHHDERVAALVDAACELMPTRLPSRAALPVWVSGQRHSSENHTAQHSHCTAAARLHQQCCMANGARGTTAELRHKHLSWYLSSTTMSSHDVSEGTRTRLRHPPVTKTRHGNTEMAVAYVTTRSQPLMVPNYRRPLLHAGLHFKRVVSWAC